MDVFIWIVSSIKTSTKVRKIILAKFQNSLALRNDDVTNEFISTQKIIKKRKIENYR